MQSWLTPRDMIWTLLVNVRLHCSCTVLSMIKQCYITCNIVWACNHHIHIRTPASFLTQIVGVADLPLAEIFSAGEGYWLATSFGVGVRLNELTGTSCNPCDRSAEEQQNDWKNVQHCASKFQLSWNLGVCTSEHKSMFIRSLLVGVAYCGKVLTADLQ